MASFSATKKVVAAGAIVLSFVAAAIGYYVAFVPEWRGEVTVDTKLWSGLGLVEIGQPLHRPETEHSTLPKGTIVDVMRTRYGKDYWACEIRTEGGVKGWVLCTDLNNLSRGA